MAGKKGRSGRKKSTVKKQQPRQQRVEVLPPVALVPDNPPAENVEVKNPSLLDKMKSRIQLLLPQAEENPQSPTPSGSSESTPEFEVLAEQLENKYGEVSGEPAAAVPGPEATQINLGPGHVIPPSMVESWLMIIFGGLEKAHGAHWKLSETDKTVLVPVYTSAIDEQAPRWLAESPNRNAWIAVLVTLFLVLSRTKSGGRLVEWGIDKVSSLVSKAGGTIKAG